MYPRPIRRRTFSQMYCHSYQTLTQSRTLAACHYCQGFDCPSHGKGTSPAALQNQTGQFCPEIFNRFLAKLKSVQYAAYLIVQKFQGFQLNAYSRRFEWN